MDAVVTQDASLTMDDVLDALATARSRLPRDAMQWTLDNWDIAGPRFVALLEAFADGTDRSERAGDILLFALHLLAEKRETAAFPALCRLIGDWTVAEPVLDEWYTETLTGIIISVFDGNTDSLKTIIESEDGDECVRMSALNALSYLAHTGVAASVDMHDYLLHLFDTMMPRSACFIWGEWAVTIARHGYADLEDWVKRAVQLGWIDKSDMDMDYFRRELQQTLSDPTRMAGFEHDSITPFDSAIGELSTWYAFSEQRRLDDQREAELALFPPPPPPPPSLMPDRDPFRHVGRNDPCPCGSGKKYKKCCLQ